MSDTQKVAVLTGASSGIGAATRALAPDGYRVALLAGGGDIVSISSVARRIARPGNGVYAATRWGLNGWSESLRRELLPDVRVTLIEPGAVATELPTHTTYAETKQGTEALYGQVEVTAKTSSRSSPSPSAGRGASPSTRSSYAQPATSSERAWTTDC
jgi:NADP-dependent 3-hydroxy acid dehydrogenase YdfG